MANPYEAPLDSTEPEAPPRRGMGIAGCGCAIVVIGLLFLSLLTIQVKVDQPVAPVVVPTPSVTPAPPAVPAQPLKATPEQ